MNIPVDPASVLRLKMGALNVTDGPRTPFGARLAVFPATVDEAVEAVALAASEGIPVLPVGGGTSVDAVAPVPPEAMLLSSVRMNRLVEYQPENLVVTVEAGMVVTELQETLRRKRQFVALNPPDAEAATVGGIVAAAATGSWRAGYGGARDYVLEINAVDAEARRIRGGARVVKNVAGYDLPKLYTGSRGTLAFLTQVTLKTRPLPEQVTRLAFSAPAWEAVYERVDALVRSSLRVTVLEIVRQDLRDPNERPTAHIALEGSTDTVQWQTTAVMDLLRGNGATIGRVEEEPALPRAGDVELTVRVPPMDTLYFMDSLTRRHDWRGAAACYPAEGRIVLRYTAYPDSPAQLAVLRAEVEARRGAVTVERMPRAWLGAVDPWGAPRPDAALARAIKQKLDPANVFGAALPVG
jgi:glycolate oxidase FAD binding subunit